MADGKFSLKKSFDKKILGKTGRGRNKSMEGACANHLLAKTSALLFERHCEFLGSYLTQLSHEKSFMRKVPYFCKSLIINNVFFEKLKCKPAHMQGLI
jgi:hypothetical protein